MRWEESDYKKAIRNHEIALESDPGNDELLKCLQILYLSLARERLEGGKENVFERQQEKKTRK